MQKIDTFIQIGTDFQNRLNNPNNSIQESAGEERTSSNEDNFSRNRKS